ncbi:hypothetical protein BDF19DRAFT_434874 [Syncephalis fuscata]|nr:hypothetical protein BDF19DRAFT_434874 [Syncephalis fuscata]
METELDQSIDTCSFSSFSSSSLFHTHQWHLNDSNESLLTSPNKWPALLSLPAELILEVMTWLPSDTFFALAYTCHRCYQVVAGEPNLHYSQLYRLCFPTWRTEQALIAYWRDSCELTNWWQIYHRRCQLEMAWRRGDWQYRTKQLPGRDDMTARSLLVNADMGATVAARAGGHLVRVALPQPRSPSKSLKIIAHASSELNEQAIERVADHARGPVELRANRRYLLALVHNQGRIGIMDATLWCVHSLRFLARISVGPTNCRLMGRHLIRVHAITGQTDIIEPIIYPQALNTITANTTSSARDLSASLTPVMELHSNTASPTLSSPSGFTCKQTILAPGVQLIRHKLPKLDWSWDVVAADSVHEDIWLIAGGSERNCPDHCSWAILQLAPTPSYNEMTALSAAGIPPSKLALRARILQQDTIQLHAITIHVLEAQLDGDFLLLTGSANPRSTWHYQHRNDTASSSTAGKPPTRHMSDVLTDPETIETTEKAATEAYRWLYVRSLDGKYSWRRHFTLGSVRSVRLHTGLNRICVHLANRKLCILQASDGHLLGEMDFFGGALLYHVLGPICVSVDQGRSTNKRPIDRSSLLSSTTNTISCKDESIKERLLNPPPKEKYAQRLIVYDLVRIQIIGVYPLPVNDASMLSGSFSFAVSPVQLAFRDARSSTVTSIIFDET